MVTELQYIDKRVIATTATEPEVESYSVKFLTGLGYTLKHRKTGNPDIDKLWPSKALDPKRPGAPDLLVYVDKADAYPFCIWENKVPSIAVDDAVDEAKFYVERLHTAKPITPGLPRLVAGFNGTLLRLRYFNHEKKWVSLRVNGAEVTDAFVTPSHVTSGISSTGNFLAAKGLASANDLRKILPALKTIYRSIPILASGRRPIDFTVALLTLRMLCEMRADWGSWAEQPGLTAGTKTVDQAIGERFSTLVGRVFKDPDLRLRYGDIFKFAEKAGSSKEEVAFSFEDCLKDIPSDAGFFSDMFTRLDDLPPLHGADFDVFGEVYQAIGDDATKKALGEFFTGRHIISALVPVLFQRAGMKSFKHGIEGKTIADLACGTGGFLTETLRFLRKRFELDEDDTKRFASRAFFGYDLSHANASRARVNMYFAGDGFSVIEGGIDTLGVKALPNAPKDGMDFILTNPPYGQSVQYQRLEESFLTKVLATLKPGAGWGLIVLPTGVLENPRSAGTRLNLLRQAKVTDVVSLPKHAFAPYTMQKTAIVIFQKREKELAGTTWNDLLKEIKDEKIALFIVDNDGFANSDKRYPTARTLSSGEWMHNDLAPWLDAKDGGVKAGKLFSAAINGLSPKQHENEFGEPIGKKYSYLTIKAMFRLSRQRDSEQGRGLALLPDAYLRPSHQAIPLPDFLVEVNSILGVLKGKASAGLISFEERVKRALITPIVVPAGSCNSSKIKDAFDAKKGDQGLTEAVIYGQIDPNGIPVYGGGDALPRFKISKKAKNKAGVDINVHQGPALVIAMDGSSGAVRVIERDAFCCNHHACVLKVKKGVGLNLYAVAQQIEGGLRSLASNKEGSATLTMPFLEDFTFNLPQDRKQVTAIASRRKILARIRDRFFGKQ